MSANPAVAGVAAAPTILRGKSFPLGAGAVDGGVNFSVFSKEAEKVELLLFDEVNDNRPSRIFDLDCDTHRTWQYWHVFVPALRAGQAYGYRARGPFAPAKGLRFDGDKLLLDPYARCIVAPPGRNRLAACQPGDNAAAAYQGVIADPGSYDWEDDVPPRTPYHETVIYEMHVGHFTRHPSSGVAQARRGTYTGVIDKIPYLTDLGVSAVELLPVFAFDEQAAPAGRRNVWGYQPVSFFAPHPGYSAASSPLVVLDKFRDMVKALHRAGIEVILGVVYNYTAEGGRAHARLPGFCQRDLLHPRSNARRLCRLHRVRQLARCERDSGPQDDSRQPALLGEGDARGRIPVRSRRSAVTG